MAKTARMLRFLFKAVCFAALFSLIFSPTGRSDALRMAPVAARVLQDVAANGEADILVVFNNLPADSLAQRPFSTRLEQGQQVYAALSVSALSAQASLLARLEQAGILVQSFTVVNSLALRATASLVQEIARMPEVAYITSDAPFRVDLEQPQASPAPNAATDPIQWNIAWVNAPALWALGARGGGIVYANADTGVQWDHPNLRDQYRGWNGTAVDHNYNWWDGVRTPISGAPVSVCPPPSNVPCDDNGHGTHTMGTGVGNAASGTQIGMAPEAKWIACHNMDAGVGRPSTYLSCFQFFLAPTDLAGNNPDPSKRPDVVGNSYSCPLSEQCIDLRVMKTAAENLRAAGIFMSVSAGNDGSSGCSSINTPPSIEPAFFTVGSSSYKTNVISSFSSRGPAAIGGSSWLKPDLVAPGGAVYSSYRNNAYGTLSGTSMASPNVAGAVALLWSARPELRGDIDRTEHILTYSALHLEAGFGSVALCGTDSAISMPNNTYGFGELDVLAAYNWRDDYSIFGPLVSNQP